MEFNLSNKIFEDSPLADEYKDICVKDVKEFIKRLIADEHINSSGEASKRILKLAGDKLTDNLGGTKE